MTKKKTISRVTLLGIVIAVSCASALSQGYTGGFKGGITNNHEPAANLQVVFTDVNTGKQYTSKTDERGEVLSTGMQPAVYKLEVMDAKNEVVYAQSGLSLNSNEINPLPGIELNRREASGSTAGGAQSQPAAKMTKEQVAKARAENEKLMGLNTQIMQAQTALQQQNWAEAESVLKQILAAIPDTRRWELYKALGDSQKNQDKTGDAIRTYEKGVEIAQMAASGAIPPDPHNPNSDPARAKAGEGQMLGSLASMYVKQGNVDQAIATYERAAAVAPNPATAYYNLCALAFNAGKYDDAAAACDKSVAADPNKADAWFFKGAALAKANKPGAADAMNKYLQLDATGVHAAEAKAILQSAK